MERYIDKYSTDKRGNKSGRMADIKTVCRQHLTSEERRKMNLGYADAKNDVSCMLTVYWLNYAVKRLPNSANKIAFISCCSGEDIK